MPAAPLLSATCFQACSRLERAYTLSYNECHLRFRSGLLLGRTAVLLSADPFSWVSCASSFISSCGRLNVNDSWPTPTFVRGLLTGLSNSLPWLQSLCSSLLS